MKYNIRSYIHVIVQFSSLLFILLSGETLPKNVLLVPELLGAVLGIWSVWEMRKSVLSVFPDPGQGFQLIKSGPYKLIRHPMYAALFLFITPLLINDFSLIRLVALLLFATNQIIKMQFEEKLLKSTIPGYSDYAKNTCQIVPFVY